MVSFVEHALSEPWEGVLCEPVVGGEDGSEASGGVR